MSNEHNNEEKSEIDIEKILNTKNEVRTTFTPSKPVQDQNIFSGRKEQVKECCGILESPGLHGILFGDRGVGKTSFANIVSIFLGSGLTIDGKIDDINFAFIEKANVIKVECSTSTTFKTLIQDIYSRINITKLTPTVGFAPEHSYTEKDVTLLSQTNEKTSFLPQHIAETLRQIPGKHFIIIDEFDRLQKGDFKLSDFTDFLKTISDVGEKSNIHFLIIGVGENVSQIIGEHASIERNLTQIHMEAMTEKEIKDIIKRGMTKLNMDIPEKLIENITSICCGYPHYAHLISLHACLNALNDNRFDITKPDVDFAISKSIEKANDGLKHSYRAATMTNRQNIYPEVLYACSICKRDEFGSFQTKDLQQHLAHILKRPIQVTQFSSHLVNLCKEERGSILVSEGAKGRRRYKFKNPLMRAFIRLKGHSRPS